MGRNIVRHSSHGFLQGFPPHSCSLHTRLDLGVHLPFTANWPLACAFVVWTDPVTLKITTKSTPHLLTFKLEGRLAVPFVDEFEAAWQQAAPKLGNKHILVDLRDVTFADAAGQQLLGEIYERTQAEFLAETPLTRYFASAARCTTHKKNANAQKQHQKAPAHVSKRKTK